MTDYRLAFAAAALAAMAVGARAQDRGYGSGYDAYGPAPATAEDARDRGYEDRSYQDRGHERGGYEGRGYEGRSYGRRDDGPRDREGYGGPDARLVGPGVRFLLPELRDTPRGRAFVRRFDDDRDGVVEQDEARAANRAFRDGAPLRPALREPDDRPPPPPPPAYDAGAMRSYHFRQGRFGAVFTLQDVLFETGSARLRPAADAKLRPIAGYLRSHPAQQLRIDGYTDSVGSAQANLLLSRDRARSVADALTALGVDGSRLHLEGHGEDSPVASNLDAAGRQQNRRVEVTLVGARAASFD